jgi:iron(III) transport system permease protein
METELEKHLTPTTRLLRTLIKKLVQPRSIIGICLLIVLSYLIVIPLITLVKDACSFGMMDAFELPGVQEGKFTLYHWKKVFNNYDVFIKPFINTLLVGFGTVGIIAVIGTLIAWIVSRTDIPLKGLITVLATLPYVLPSWALALPWIEIFQNTGLNMAPGYLEYLTGVKTPPWLVIGPVPTIIVLGLHYFPFGFLLVAAALRNVNSELEETAELLGASRLTILRTITLPIVTPALLSALILGFSMGIGSYGAPTLLGLPARFNVLSVQIFSLMEMNLHSQAYILAIMLIVLCSIVIYVNNRVIGLRKGFETIGGKGVRKRFIPLRKLRIPVSALVIVFLSISVVVPLAILIWSSFLLNEGDYSIANLSLQYWTGLVDPKDPRYIIGEPGVFRNPKFFLAVKNTFLISGVGAAILGVLGMLVGYVVVMGRGKRISILLEWITFSPLLIPSIAFGAIYISLFGVSRGPIPALYGTYAIMILVVIGKKITYAARCGISAMHQPSKELEEAGVVLGAGWLKRFKQIIWPLTKTGFSSGFLLIFITTTRELSLFIMLVSGKTQMMTTLIFEMAELGVRQLAFAYMTVLITITFIVIGIYRLYERHSKKSLMEKGIL